MRNANVDDALDKHEHGGMEWSESGGEVRAAAIDGQCVLHEVVGADAEKRDVVDQRVDR